MSNPNPLVICKEQISQSAVKFATSELSYEAEEVYAIQHLMKNDYLLNTAMNEPASLRLAMYNVAALGLTLNPTRGLAYLIPRSNKKGEPPKIVLDVSYRGMIALANSEGIVANAVCELVYEQDVYTFKGPTRIPDHDANVFSTNRGQVIGGYCITELVNGKIQVHNMSKADMDQIRDSSQAYSHGGGPWKDWESQMQLKSILKRAGKWWPTSTPKMAKLVEYLNVENGEGLATLQQSPKNIETMPALESDIDSKTLSFINNAVSRAVSTQSFEACKELLVNRIKDPAFLSFALQRLDGVRPVTETDYQEAV